MKRLKYIAQTVFYSSVAIVLLIGWERFVLLVEGLAFLVVILVFAYFKHKRKGKPKAKPIANNTETIIHDMLAQKNLTVSHISSIESPQVVSYYVQVPPIVGARKTIEGIAEDLESAIRAKSISIIPANDKGAMMIQVAKARSGIVHLEELVGNAFNKMQSKTLPLLFGINTQNEQVIVDLKTEAVHLLVGGATGSGKSVGVNALIMGLLCTKHPKDVRFVFLDPLAVEFQAYDVINQIFGVHFDGEPTIHTKIEDIVSVLNGIVALIDERYALLAQNRMKEAVQYRAKGGFMPDVVIMMDEVGFLMESAKPEIESAVNKMFQVGRKCGVHLVAATQNPLAEKLPNDLKSNTAYRWAFQVSDGSKSQTILGQGYPQAQELVGKGDSFLRYGVNLERIKAPFISDDDAETLLEQIARHYQNYTPDPLFIPVPESDTAPKGKYEAAVSLIESGEVINSKSQLRSKLGLGGGSVDTIWGKLKQEGYV